MIGRALKINLKKRCIANGKRRISDNVVDNRIIIKNSTENKKIMDIYTSSTKNILKHNFKDMIQYYARSEKEFNEISNFVHENNIEIVKNEHYTVVLSNNLILNFKPSDIKSYQIIDSNNLYRIYNTSPYIFNKYFYENNIKKGIYVYRKYYSYTKQNTIKISPNILSVQNMDLLTENDIVNSMTGLSFNRIDQPLTKNGFFKLYCSNEDTYMKLLTNPIFFNKNLLDIEPYYGRCNSILGVNKKSNNTLLIISKENIEEDIRLLFPSLSHLYSVKKYTLENKHIYEIKTYDSKVYETFRFYNGLPIGKYDYKMIYDNELNPLLIAPNILTCCDKNITENEFKYVQSLGFDCHFNTNLLIYAKNIQQFTELHNIGIQLPQNITTTDSTNKIDGSYTNNTFTINGNIQESNNNSYTRYLRFHRVNCSKYMPLPNILHISNINTETIDNKISKYFRNENLKIPRNNFVHLSDEDFMNTVFGYTSENKYTLSIHSLDRFHYNNRLILFPFYIYTNGQDNDELKRSHKLYSYKNSNDLRYVLQQDYFNLISEIENKDYKILPFYRELHEDKSFIRVHNKSYNIIESLTKLIESENINYLSKESENYTNIYLNFKDMDDFDRLYHKLCCFSPYSMMFFYPGVEIKYLL